MRIVRFLLLMVTCLWALPALAQRGETVEFNGGYTMVIPDGWEEVNQFGAGSLFENGDSSILVLDPRAMERILDDETPVNATEALMIAYEAEYDESVDDEILPLPSTPFDAVIYTAVERNDVFMFATARVGDNLFVTLDAVTPPDEIETTLTAIIEMIDSFEGDDVVATAGDDAATTTVSTPAEPCTVSVDTANTAQLRVGPGTNRSSVAFLPPNVDVDVIGFAVADDGSEWFLVDKEQAAPQSAASELWVAREQVDEQGDCDAVGEVAAPPIVPITSSNPPPPPASSSDPAPAAGGTTVGGSIVPQSGRWSLTLNANMAVSCSGSNSVTVPTVDVFGRVNFVADISTTGDASVIIVDGDRFVFQGGNMYMGNFDFGGTSNSQLRLTFTSATSLNGELVFNETLNGRACSATVYMSGRR
ncbi:MAG: hypothetical protein SF123_15545 [Chloroflexota bacterium]|nr:hypothetical protein [Chloroflexota bacterium]